MGRRIARLSDWAAGWVAGATLALWAAQPASACPFCGVVEQPLAQRRDEATVVAIGEAEKRAAVDALGFTTQPFRILQLLRGEDDDASGTVAARVAGTVAGTAVLFGTAVAAADPAEDRLAWSAVAADETLLGYVSAAPAVTTPAAERLRWFARRLEHPDRTIAADAFAEFGLASLDAVRGAADALDSVQLRAWVGEPSIDERRRGFYGLALGIVAAATNDPAVARDCIATLRHTAEAPGSDFRAGFDGLLAGILVAEGTAGLDFLGDRGLLEPTARALDQRHLLAALRFAWENLADTIPRDRVAAATEQLLTSPAVAADAIIDLARYRRWSGLEDVSRVWDALGNEDPLVRRAVAGYLAACPLPSARRELDRIRLQSPELLQQALEAATTPAAR
ncbi:MAG: hypothetical protein HQ464_08955 [Planctomycetes bacterium]|nr:hypothetical protein [Planctomycetota bacterium]